MKLNTQKIEKKIKSINKILKISKAMKIISSMNIRRIQPKIKENLFILNDLQKTIQIISYFKELSLNNYNIKNNKIKNNKIIRIIFSSDLGLCGGYNNDLFKYIEENIGKEDPLIIIGKKGIEFFTYYKRKIVWSEISENFFLEKINELLNKIFKDFKNFNINVIYFGIDKEEEIKIKDIQIFPFESFEKININEFESYKIEPFVDKIFDDAIFFYLKIMLIKIKDESKYTEEINRRFAMEAANDNAKEIIFDLKLKYNQLRQEKITKEIINISQSD